MLATTSKSRPRLQRQELDSRDECEDGKGIQVGNVSRWKANLAGFGRLFSCTL